MTLKEIKNFIENFTVDFNSCFVHNVLGTQDEPIPEGYDSFLEYWECKTGKSVPTNCQAIDSHTNQDGTEADTTDIVGAHVRIDGLSCPDDWAWIVPLCKHCNSDGRTWCIELPQGTILVPIKMSKSHPTAKNDMDGLVKLLNR